MIRGLKRGSQTLEAPELCSQNATIRPEADLLTPTFTTVAIWLLLQLVAKAQVLPTFAQ